MKKTMPKNKLEEKDMEISMEKHKISNMKLNTYVYKVLMCLIINVFVYKWDGQE